MNNIAVRYCDLPCTVRGFVVRQCEDDEFYTIILNSRLTHEQLKNTYLHELQHIVLGDFDSALSVSQIELLRH